MFVAIYNLNTMICNLKGYLRKWPFSAPYNFMMGLKNLGCHRDMKFGTHIPNRMKNKKAKEVYPISATVFPWQRPKCEKVNGMDEFQFVVAK